MTFKPCYRVTKDVTFNLFCQKMPFIHWRNFFPKYKYKYKFSLGQLETIIQEKMKMLCYAIIQNVPHFFCLYLCYAVS